MARIYNLPDQDYTNSNPIAIPYSPIAIGILICSFSLYIIVICCCLYQAIFSDEKAIAEAASQDNCIYCSRSRRALVISNGNECDGEERTRDIDGIINCPVHGQPLHTNFHLQTHSNLPIYPPSLDASISSYSSASVRPPSYKSQT